MRGATRLSAAAMLLALSSLLVQAQTASLSGTVTDQMGAVIQGATVELRDVATNIASTSTTNDEGVFTFTNVAPGTYKLTATAKGFKTAVVPALKLEVGRSPSLALQLRAGGVDETVTVEATGLQLQTLDASVGNVLTQSDLDRMPSISRDATSLLLLQPLAIPGFNTKGASGADNLQGGAVAGARADQHTFLIDGGDATSNTEAGGGYNNGFVATPRAAIPTPTESLEEFRVTTNNSNASFSQSAGGQVQMVTRRGTNTWHGAAYLYLQHDNLNANTFPLNLTGQPRPEERDGRFGGKLGGPIFKDRTFFFVHYEGRRFLKNEDFTRLVPSDQMKQGILQFRDGTGNVVSYDVTSFDPRGIGINPVVQDLWTTFMPPGNNPTGGNADGLNTLGFTSSVPFVVNENFGVARLDHRISNKWDFLASYRYGVTDAQSTAQIDIGGITPGATLGVPKATNSRPLQPRYLVTGLTGRLTSNVTNDFRFNWLRHWWQWSPVTPFPQVAGTDAALAIGGTPRSAESRLNTLIPLNVDTQNARQRVWNGHDYTFTDNVNWLKGNHLIQFGGRYTRQDLFHIRDDKVVGGLTTPVYQISSGSNITVPAANRPPLCAGAVQTNCLANTTDVARWDAFYLAVLGTVERGTQMLTRAADFSPNPSGTPTVQDTGVQSWQLYASDTWRITPSFTLTYGLTWNVQLPPFEKSGKDAMLVDASTGQIIDTQSYFVQKALAAEQGQVFNPELGLMSVGSLGRKYPYDTQYNAFGPRLAFAWNPSFTGGFLGGLFGDKRSVIRAGYARVFDRENGVGIVMTPALAAGFGIAVSCRGPRVGGGCVPGSDPSNAFRIGIDGTGIPIPTLSPISGNILIPGFTPNANAPDELLDFRIDPKRKYGVEEMFDFSIQRELPGSMLLEFGYVGRLGYHLTDSKSLTQIPYMFTAGGQSFADAFDAVAISVRNGQPLTAQPFFETIFPGGTAAFATNYNDQILGGLVWDIWQDLDAQCLLQTACTTGTTPAFGQIFSSTITTSNGRSYYHAGFVTLRKRMSHGLTFQLNYTLSKSLDHFGLTQENVFEPTDSFNIDRDFGYSLFDRRHTFNAFYLYELPFARGAGGALERILGGWSVSGIFTAASGLPLDVCNGGSFQDLGGGSGFFTACTGLVPLQPGVIQGSRHDDVGGSINLFADPTAVINNFREPLFGDARVGRGTVRGQGRWNFDLGISKVVRINERVSTRFDFQAFNLFNNPQLADPLLFTPVIDITAGGSFGVIQDTQFNSPRFIQLGLRIDF